MASAQPPSPGMFVPSDHAERLGEELIEASDLQEELLEETLQTGEEAGRSVCGNADQVKDAEETSFSGVVLPGCPINRRGLMHGGGGHDLEAPVHSLLDMGNVLFGLADASIVVGSNQSDVFLAPREDQLDEARTIYRNALGADVSGVDDVVAALDRGEIRNPATARQRIRTELDGLFQKVSTPHPLVTQEATVAAPAVNLEAATQALAQSRDRANNVGRMIGQIGNEAFTFDLEEVEINLAQLVIGQFADALVLVFFLMVLGSRPSGFVRGTLGQ